MLTGYDTPRGGISRPILNPQIHRTDDVDEVDPSQRQIPHIFQNDFHTLESYIGSKSEIERLRMCAFYNKYFPNLEMLHSYSGASYHAVPFTSLEQEVQDAGMGLSKNYLKACIDTVVSRLKNISFQLRIQGATPLLLLEMYRPQLERYFKSQIDENRLVDMVTEVFHDSSILNHSHALMDPWSKKTRKINDWEVGIYESEFNNYDVKRCLIIHRTFPVASLGSYVDGFKKEDLARVLHHKDAIPLYLYMDCFSQKKFVMIDNLVGPVTSYPFETVLIESYDWDMGIKRSMTTCLFEMLFPLQRQINALTAKLTTNYLNYKGTMPVISSLGDVEAVKTQLTNRSGEVLILSGATADVAKMIGQIDIVPLDQNASALIETLKANMIEIAGVQEISLDLSNLRSAAAVVAIDKLRDTRFESQMYKAAAFVKGVLTNIVRFNAGMKEPIAEIPWDQLLELTNSRYVELIPIHTTDMEDKPTEPPENFVMYAVNKFLIDVVNGRKSFDDIDYTINFNALKIQAINMLQRFKSLEGNYDTLEHLVIRLFIQDIRKGVVRLTEPTVLESDIEGPVEDQIATGGAPNLQAPDEGGGEDPSAGLAIEPGPEGAPGA